MPTIKVNFEIELTDEELKQCAAFSHTMGIRDDADDVGKVAQMLINGLEAQIELALEMQSLKRPRLPKSLPAPLSIVQKTNSL